MKTLLSLLLLVPLALAADEGKWTPQQMLELDPAALRKFGLQLPPKMLWDPDKGTGLLAATIQVGGCSGGFISAEGLFITNHHCLFSILQEHATPQKDIITNGYVANSREQELTSKTLRLTFPRRFIDVTKDVLAAVPPNASDAQRYRAIERKMTELVVECEKQPGMRCKVAAHDAGVQYVLAEATELADVRLVYAPPRAIGEFGGEVDNWMWPRHTGDFAIGRAYVNGKPFKPEFFFPISAKGVKPNDFVMVLGYPGTTYRALTADEMSERRDLFFSRRHDLFGEWIRVLEEATKGNSAGEIAVADNLKTLANRFKNASGQLVGFRRGSILEKQRERDQDVLTWAAKNPQHREAVEAYRGLSAMIAAQRRTWERDFLLSQIQPTATTPNPLGPKTLYFGGVIARSAIERTKADPDRDQFYMQRNLSRTRDRIEREQKNIFLPAEKRLFASFVKRALSLPDAQRIAAIDRLFAGATGEEGITNRIEDLFAHTKIFDLGERMKMFGETEEQLRARRDPLVDLGFEIDRELRAYGERKESWEGTISRLRPVWRRAVAARAGHTIAPDANSTLRVSFAHVEGYEPRDGVVYVPHTTLSGIVEKHTGEEPFNVPARVLSNARIDQDAPSRWADPKLRDVPVNFLATADTTGGSSGSPVLNSRGELVGVNFDRVWENVANDFGYNPEVNRNINVDVRYLLWLLSEVEHAEPLLRELGVQ